MAGLLTPLMALYASKGIVVLFAIAALPALYTLVIKKKIQPSMPGLLVWSVLAMAIWAAASLGWSVSFDISWPLVRSLPFTLLGGVVIVTSLKLLDSEDRGFVGRLTVAGFIFGAIMALIDTATGHKIYYAIDVYKYGGGWNGNIAKFVINNGITVLTMFLWPAFLFLISQNRRDLALVGLIAVIIIAGNGSNFAAIVALGVGLAGVALAYYFPRYIHWVIGTGLTLLILGAPFVMKALPDARTIGKDLPELSYSVYPRLVIWQYAADKILDRPLTGHGIRTSRALNEETEPIWFVYRDNGKIEKGNTKAIPLHPHNGVIQMWLELGGIGALIGLGVVLSVLGGIKNYLSAPLPKALMYGAFLSSMCLVSVSYGLWQNWWMGALWIQGALILASAAPREDSDPDVIN